MMNGQHTRPATKKRTRTEKIHIARDIMFGAVGVVSFCLMNKAFYLGINAGLLCFGTAMIYSGIVCYYEEFMRPEIEARHQREARRRAARHRRQEERRTDGKFTVYGG